jgi:glycosyltransferase involved in cell wall biosynthesis
LRILHVAFSDKVSGSSRYIGDLSQRQLMAGHAVGVALTARGPGLTIYDGLPQGVEVLSVLRSPGYIGLARAIRGFKPDVLHFHDGRGPRAVRWLPGRPPSVVTLHLGYKHAMAPADGLIRIADWQSADAFDGPTVTVPNWRPKAGDPNQDVAAALRQSIAAGPQTFLVGCVGRLHPAKGAGLLLDSLQQVAPSDTMFVFIGDGAARAELEARAAGDPRVRFIGLRQDVDAWYAAMDAIVAPSYLEQSPLVVLEAMSAGLPIAAAANPGAVEMLKGQPARLFPVGDAAALADILNGWAANPPQRVAYDMSRFEPDRAALQIEAFYHLVIQRRRKRRTRRANST